MRIIPIATLAILSLAACGDLLEDRCLDVTLYPTAAMQQQCQSERAIRIAAMSNGSGGEALSDSKARSGAMEPGETTGSTGTTDSGVDAGFGSISG